VRYFLDNCLSHRYAAMLRALNVDIVALREELTPDTPDVRVFQHLATSDRVFITADRRQLVRVAEATELRSAGISAIYFSKFWGTYDLWGQAAWLVSRWPLIDQTQSGLAKGSVVELKHNGKSLLIPA
jgi:hypothetical protein